MSQWQNQAVLSRLTFLISRRCGRFRGWDALQGSTSSPNLTGPSSALPVFPSIRRSVAPPRDGSVRVVYAARIGNCRPCPMREECQGYGATTKKPRRVSAVLWPLDKTEKAIAPSLSLSASHPILWGDWQRCFHRREVVKLLRYQRVDVELAATAPPAQSPPVRLFSRAERAHWRLSWAERLARNARPKTAPDISIKLFGIPDTFATSLGLRIA